MLHDFQNGASTMTLADGLAGYHASRDDLTRGRGLSPQAQEFFRCHDTAHVLFGTNAGFRQLLSD
ncbi:MAG: hypothetical protein P8R42_05825 [Candidatus Binatia bacterium]|nr:hypothetical protein [Candidatus Binatia bacterium]